MLREVVTLSRVIRSSSCCIGKGRGDHTRLEGEEERQGPDALALFEPETVDLVRACARLMPDKRRHRCLKPEAVIAKKAYSTAWLQETLRRKGIAPGTRWTGWA